MGKIRPAAGKMRVPVGLIAPTFSDATATTAGPFSVTVATHVKEQLPHLADQTQSSHLIKTLSRDMSGKFDEGGGAGKERLDDFVSRAHYSSAI
jgi:hypothetical protein